ncbi:hypothetical protein MBLNU459_g6862t1 [Dothideomycetes sp. NU459]
MSASNGHQEPHGLDESGTGAVAATAVLPIETSSVGLRELGIPGAAAASAEDASSGPSHDSAQPPIKAHNDTDGTNNADEQPDVARTSAGSTSGLSGEAEGAPRPIEADMAPRESTAPHEVAQKTEEDPFIADTPGTPPGSTPPSADTYPGDKAGVRSPSPPPPPPKDDKFLNPRKDSAGKAPVQPYSPAHYDEKRAMEDSAFSGPSRDETGDSRSEIQSIMDQFDDDTAGPELERIMSAGTEAAQSPFHPPRSSSLEPMASYASSPILQRTQSRDSYVFSPSAVRPGSVSGVSISRDSTASPRPASTIFQPPPPSPDPEPALPFDFHRFLEQLRHRTADPVARFLRSFLMEFGKKQWMVHEQVKIISDFLEFISKKMALCEVWRTVSDVEFDNAREGMEKLVMNRLYSQTFSPAIPPVEVVSPTKGKRTRNQAQSPHAPGRRGQHQEDVERDSVIAQKIRIYGWIREEHLDIAAVSEKGQKFLTLAQKELLKINSYRAPRDKVICVLNCCKVIFGFLKNAKSDQSADAFVPLLIYTVLRANPEHIASNVQYILRFRNQDKLGGEAGYYISSLMGVVSFVENLDRTNLTITDEEFERNVENAVSAIAEGHKAEAYEASTHSKEASAASTTPVAQSSHPHFSEKGSLSRPEVTSRNSTEGEQSTPRRGNSTRQTNSTGVSSGDEGEEHAAVAGLLRTIQKPLSTIGRMFSDDSSPQPHSQHPALTPQPGSTPRLSPHPPSRPLERKSSEEARSRRSPERQPRARSVDDSRTNDDAAENAAARQASAEAAEAQSIRAQEHRVVVETLQGMFPDLDSDVISDVVRMKEGRVGLAVDACLALSN